MRADARHLRHDDYRRPSTGYVHHLLDVVEGDHAGVEVFKRIVRVDVPFRHPHGSLLVEWADQMSRVLDGP